MDYAVSALRGAAAEFLQKPVSRADLVAKATELIEAGRAAREERAAGARAEPSGAAAGHGALPRPRQAPDQLTGAPAEDTEARSARPG